MAARAQVAAIALVAALLDAHANAAISCGQVNSAIAPLPRLRSRHRLRPLGRLLQRRQEPQRRRQDLRRQEGRVQLPQVRRRQDQRPQAQQRPVHPEQMRRQPAVQHQHLHRLLTTLHSPFYISSMMNKISASCSCTPLLLYAP
jgi:hypothetical protein